MVPYEMPPMSGLLVPGGQTGVFVVPFPSRSYITKVVCMQYDGVLADFTLEMFNNKIVMTGGQSLSDSVGPDVGPIPEDLFAIGPPFQGVAGVLRYFADSSTGGRGFSFYNQDGPDPGRQGVNPRRLYVRIKPLGSGDKHFALCIGGDQAVSGA